MLPRLVALGPDAVGDGDPLLLPETFGPTPLSQIQSQFGESFAHDLLAAPDWPLGRPAQIGLMDCTSSSSRRQNQDSLPRVRRCSQ